MYIHLQQIIKNRGPSLHNSLHQTDNRKHFLGLSLTQNQREVYMFHLAKEVETIWRSSCLEKGNFILISEFKYGQT